MKTTDYLSLNKSATKNISDELQNLLADFQVYYESEEAMSQTVFS